MTMPPPPQQPQQPQQQIGPLGQQSPPPGFAQQTGPQQSAPRNPQQAPPPGYGGAPTQAMPASPAPASKAMQLVWTLGLISLAGVVLGLSLEEDGSNQWDSVKAWGGVAILGAVLTLMPAMGRSLGLSAQRAWQAAACGAAALVLFWVLFTLPGVGSNVSLLTTVGVAAGVICAWVAPGRESAGAPPSGPQRPTW